MGESVQQAALVPDTLHVEKEPRFTLYLPVMGLLGAAGAVQRKVGVRLTPVVPLEGLGLVTLFWQGGACRDTHTCPVSIPSPFLALVQKLKFASQLMVENDRAFVSLYQLLLRE